MAATVLEHPHDVGGDVVFCVVIMWLSIISMLIFASVGAPPGAGRKHRSGAKANGPVFVGGRGCACGGCRAGAGVCGTYLS